VSEKKKLGLFIAVFLGAYFIPFGHPKVEGAILESFYMLSDYAREHVLLCLIPALFIAGAISNFVSQNAVLKYFGSKAKKWVSYGVASVSGSILAVCSCTVLPLFSGIYVRGAGIGPAIAFLYSGPSINILAIILTARVLGWEFGLARAIGAIVFAIIIGLIMSWLFGKEDAAREELAFPEGETVEKRKGWQELFYFANLVFILIFAAWAKPSVEEGFWFAVYSVKWPVTISLLVVLGIILYRWFDKKELKSWVNSTWDFSKQILPLLFAGVLVAGFLMGSPGSDGGIIPSRWISNLVGGNSLKSNLLSSVVGAFMYFATLTEIPIIQGLMASGMGKGPVLALLLAGPALSLPNMLVIRSVLGNFKTFVYVLLVIVMATISGLIFGTFF
jgi:uncharacterized membrane protein YraQ (UPF0718 family)